MVNDDTVSSPELLPQDDPIAHFGQWFDLAQNCGIREPSAMHLATVSAAGAPQVRVVLLRGFDQAGFCFYTNLTSAKGDDLAANPRAALGFHWQPLARQVRITGSAEILSDDLADAYFGSRHRSSQISAWASRQSAGLPDRATINARVAKMTQRFAGRPVPRPPFWSGYRVIPESVEFWQHADDRLHQRLVYRRTAAGGPWHTELLYP